MKNHNRLPSDILQNILWKCLIIIYNWNKIKEYDLHLNSIWVNQMKEHEYNPVHIHRGTLFTGLSSVMILSLPPTYGKEYSNDKFHKMVNYKY